MYIVKLPMQCQQKWQLSLKQVNPEQIMPVSQLGFLSYKFMFCYFASVADEYSPINLQPIFSNCETVDFLMLLHKVSEQIMS